MLLLDTCALIYDALAPEQLSKPASKAIEAACRSGDLAISDISLWEIAMLVDKGRLDPGTETTEFLEIALAARAVGVLPITPEIAALSVTLEIHGDPADRLIAATAVELRISLVTCDKLLRKHKALRTIW